MRQTAFRSRRFIAAALVAALALFHANNAGAQAYPTGPVRIVVPFAAGGAADLLARGVAARLGELWGQSVYVENRGGANTQIGAASVAKAPRNGYTLMLTSEGTFVMNPLMVKQLSYDAEKDFAPITPLIALKQVLIVNNSVTAKTVKELIAQAKARPSSFTYGTTGVGSSSHLAAEMLQSMAGIKLVAAHYKGAGPAMNDLLGGHIQMMFAAASSAVELQEAGKVRILATGSRTLVKGLDVPTVAESGDLPGFDGTSWFGLFAPAGTPRPIIDKIYADVRSIFADPVFEEKFLRPQKFEALLMSPDEFAASINDGRARWGKVIKDAGLSAH
ncbi:MAG: tripartite tricarboxylate transporter substrate binding protein [Hyphomicrobiales bacterium]|nr:tripartite tricarboxylate transporter substrate binding protein [Hyphomicrobiales bacterium]